MIVKSSWDGMGECYSLDFHAVVDSEDEYEITYKKLPKKVIDPKTLKPRDCSSCGSFNFTWDRYWCGLNKEGCSPSSMGVSGNCRSYHKGKPKNHEW
jgi:hypothetical protein